MLRVLNVTSYLIRVMASMCGESRRCAYFVKKRGRSCRMMASKGSEYCGEHLIHEIRTFSAASQDSMCSTETLPSRRVPCPLDPSHTVFEHALNKHLRKCNAAKRPRPVCYSAHINAGLVNYQPTEKERLPLSDFPAGMIQEVIKKVNTAYRGTEEEEHCVEIKTQILTHPSMEKSLTDPGNGATALKHLEQQSSILAHLDSLGLLSSEDTCYIEFGAGRGKLSECIQRSFQCLTSDEPSLEAETNDSDTRDVPMKRGSRNVHYILVDRESCRHKVDGVYRTSSLIGAHYHRLLMDIEHLDLGRLECLCDGSGVRQVVAVSKHLCGAATDLSLRCIVKSLLQESSGASCKSPSPKVCCQSSTKLCGIVIALCCHHRCSWPQLVGREFFENLGFTPVEFHLICKMSSWAVCGVRPPTEAKSDTLTSDANHKGAAGNTTTVGSDGDSSVRERKLPPGNNGRKRWGYVPHPNEDIGLKCKRLIDLARISYLTQHGLRARLIYYVNRTTSLENVLLVALPGQTLI